MVVTGKSNILAERTDLLHMIALSELAGFKRYEEFQAAHKQWVEAAITNGKNVRGGKWTQSIAVGSQDYIENIKDILGIHAKGRKVVGRTKIFQLRESLEPYNAGSCIKKNDIGPQNLYFWDEKQVYLIT